MKSGVFRDTSSNAQHSQQQQQQQQAQQYSRDSSANQPSGSTTTTRKKPVGTSTAVGSGQNSIAAGSSNYSPNMPSFLKEAARHSKTPISSLLYKNINLNFQDSKKQQQQLQQQKVNNFVSQSSQQQQQPQQQQQQSQGPQQQQRAPSSIPTSYVSLQHQQQLLSQQIAAAASTITSPANQQQQQQHQQQQQQQQQMHISSSNTPQQKQMSMNSTGASWIPSSQQQYSYSAHHSRKVSSNYDPNSTPSSASQGIDAGNSNGVVVVGGTLKVQKKSSASISGVTTTPVNNSSSSNSNSNTNIAAGGFIHSNHHNPNGQQQQSGVFVPQSTSRSNMDTDKTQLQNSYSASHSPINVSSRVPAGGNNSITNVKSQLSAQQTGQHFNSLLNNNNQVNMCTNSKRDKYFNKFLLFIRQSTPQTSAAGGATGATDSKQKSSLAFINYMMLKDISGRKDEQQSTGMTSATPTKHSKQPSVGHITKSTFNSRSNSTTSNFSLRNQQSNSSSSHSNSNSTHALNNVSPNSGSLSSLGYKISPSSSAAAVAAAQQHQLNLQQQQQQQQQLSSQKISQQNAQSQQQQQSQNFFAEAQSFQQYHMQAKQHQQQQQQQQQHLQAQQQQQQQKLQRQMMQQQQQQQQLLQPHQNQNRNGGFNSAGQDQSTRYASAEEQENAILQEQLQREEFYISKGQFNFQFVIGKGGFGKVWKVEQRKTRQIFAMKEMSKSLIITKKSVNSVMNERNLLCELKHPFLVNMFYSFQDRDTLFLVMDFMSGGDLRFHIGKQRRFNEETTRFFVACIFMGLEYLHKNNIIHRDIKPENLVLDDDGYVRVTDLGIARYWKPDNENDTSGTPGYMAPEVMCRQPHTFAVDYFALGVIAFEFMLGRRPYLGRSRQEIRDQILAKRVQIKKTDIPDGWSLEAADFINKLIERKPAQRLGINGPDEVKNHPWIANFPWKKLMNKELRAPFLPSQEDNFDFKQQISQDDEQTSEIIQQNAMLLRKPQVQRYNFDNTLMPNNSSHNTSAGVAMTSENSASNINSRSTNTSIQSKRVTQTSSPHSVTITPKRMNPSSFQEASSASVSASSSHNQNIHHQYHHHNNIQHQQRPSFY